MVLQSLLIKKQQTLEKHDEEILGFLTEEDDIETEIEFALQFADEIIEAITKLKWDADYIKKKMLEELKPIVARCKNAGNSD